MALSCNERKMNKYVTLEVVLPYVPQRIKDERGIQQVMFDAWEGYRIYYRLKEYSEALDICKSEVKDGRVKLPQDFRGLIAVSYFPAEPGTSSSEQLMSDSEVLGLLDADRLSHIKDSPNVIIYQNLFYGLYRDRMGGRSMRYVGQNPAIIESGCVPVLCRDCINFSVDRSMKVMTLDEKGGWVVMLYRTGIYDEHGRVLIPDDPVLHDAMAHYAIYKYWQNDSIGNPSKRGVVNETLHIAVSKFDTAIKRNILRSFDPGAYYSERNVIGKLREFYNAYRR
ncbi:MAG: hypothetical protein KatS3mg054_0069 [Chloroflexus sp.]|nr:MAG: hypothetical protein KatS3mg054_0069 [Chloroflexus sp.]